MIEVLHPTEFDRARAVGALVGRILQSVRERTAVGTNLLEIDEWTKAMILEAGATSCYVDYAPSFGRGPFGHYICTSVNDAVLHGLPRDQVLADGDLLTLDLAVTLDGVVADSAVSFVVAYLTVAWMLRFVSRHTIRVFVWYRWALAVALIIALSTGFVTANGVSA